MALNPYLTLKLDGTDVRTVQANDDTKRYAVIFDGDSQTDDTWCIGTRLPDTQTEIQGNYAFLLEVAGITPDIGTPTHTDWLWV